MKKFIISVLFLSLYSGFTQCGKSVKDGTSLHDLAESCVYGRPKCLIGPMLDYKAIDPFVKDSKGRIAREVAIQNIQKQRVGWDFCDYLAWELEEYEKRFQEKMKQVEQK